MVENDFTKIQTIVGGKTIKNLDRNDNKIIFNFTDGSTLTLKTFQYQIEYQDKTI